MSKSAVTGAATLAAKSEPSKLAAMSKVATKKLALWDGRGRGSHAISKKYLDAPLISKATQVYLKNMQKAVLDHLNFTAQVAASYDQGTTLTDPELKAVTKGLFLDVNGPNKHVDEYRKNTESAAAPWFAPTKAPFRLFTNPPGIGGYKAAAEAPTQTLLGMTAGQATQFAKVD